MFKISRADCIYETVLLHALEIIYCNHVKNHHKGHSQRDITNFRQEIMKN